MNRPHFVGKKWVLLVIFAVAFGCEGEIDGGGPRECEPDSVYRTYSNYPPKIRTMSDLAQLEGYERLTTDLMIPFDSSEDSEIDSLEYLHCLKGVGGFFSIGPLKDLENLGGLENLESAPRGLIIGNNKNLTNVDGLVGLKSQGQAEALGIGPGALNIGGNDSLLDLKGLANLRDMHGPLHITNNKSLPTCEAVALKEQLEKTGWTGEAMICGNLPDECGSDACSDQWAETPSGDGGA